MSASNPNRRSTARRSAAVRSLDDAAGRLGVAAVQSKTLSATVLVLLARLLVSVASAVELRSREVG